jgi:iron complex outermembrane recepter protein
LPLLAVLLVAGAVEAQSLEDLSALSIEDLGKVEITSVSKRTESLSQAAAAVFVITADDIRRSGAATLPEALRLAPNLEVARVNSHDYVISARGLNSVNASNKLLVLIDGRSVYTPFFSSVFWDQQDVMMADIERIEVIAGPGGTLWGANAMNGVVNVITRTSGDSQGGLLDAKAGDFLQHAAARWGGRLGDNASYRVYALGLGEHASRLEDASSAMDSWHGKQAGFRSDMVFNRDGVTVQGDAYENRIDNPTGRRSGGDLLGRWKRSFTDGASLQVQGYYDQQSRSDRGVPAGATSDFVKTFDVELEHVLAPIGRQQLVWGAGYRTWHDEFLNTINPFVLVPPRQTLSLSNVFGQDTIALRDDLKLTVGAKFEYSTFSGWAVMPSARIGWQATRRDFLWGAISRAVREPSRLERDLTAPGIVDTSPDFTSEKLVAYEAGWRSQLLPEASLSVALFYNDYSDLRTTSPAPVTVLPVTFGNGLEGHTYGADVWASYNPFRWWRINPGFGVLRKDFHLKPGQFDIAGTQTVLGHDPGHQVFLRSYMDLPHDTELYIGLRQIGSLPDVAVPSYFEADARVSWHVTHNLELSLAGSNLLHAYHVEASQPPLHLVPRNGYLGLRWSF